MSRETTTPETTTAGETSRLAARRASRRIASALRLAAVAVPIAVAGDVAMVLPGWIPVLPRECGGG